jgi:hypothetical protein
VEESGKSPRLREVEVLEERPTMSFPSPPQVARSEKSQRPRDRGAHFTQGFHGARTNRFQIEYPSALKISSLLYLHIRNLLLKSIPHLLTTATTPTNQHPPIVPTPNAPAVGCAASPANAIRSSRVSLWSHAANSSGHATRSGTAVTIVWWGITICN